MDLRGSGVGKAKVLSKDEIKRALRVAESSNLGQRDKLAIALSIYAGTRPTARDTRKAFWSYKPLAPELLSGVYAMKQSLSDKCVRRTPLPFAVSSQNMLMLVSSAGAP